MIVINLNRPSKEDLEDVAVKYYECLGRNGHEDLPKMKGYRWDHACRDKIRLAHYYGKHDNPKFGDILYIE